MTVSEGINIDPASENTDGIERLTSIFDDLTDTYYRTDASGKIVYASKSVHQLLGYSVEELIGQKLADLYFDADGRENFLNALKSSGGSVSGYRADLRHKDGSVIWVSTSSKFIFDENNDPAGVEGIARNITSEIHRENDRYRVLFTNAAVGAAILTLDGVIIEANKAYHTLFGYVDGELTGVSVIDLTHPEDVKETEAFWNTIVSRGDDFHQFEKRYITKNEDMIWCQANSAVIRVENNKPYRIIGQLVDITERKVATEALRISERRFAEIAGMTSDWYAELGPDLKYSYVSESAASHNDHQVHDVIGKTIEEFSEFRHWQVEPDTWDQLLDDLSNHREFKNFERYIVLPDGNRGYRETTFKPIHGPDGEFGGYHLVTRDTTEQKRANDAIATSEKRLRSILESAVDSIITINDRGHIETVNPATETLFGYNQEELIGHNIKLLMPEPDRSAHDRYLSDYKSTGKSKIIGVGRDVEGRRKDGTTFPLRLSISESDFNGNTVFTGILHDLRERSEAEKIERRFLNAIEQFDAGFALWDENERLILWNDKLLILAPEFKGLPLKGISYWDLMEIVVDSQPGHYLPSEREHWVGELVKFHRENDHTDMEVQRDNKSWLRRQRQRFADGTVISLITDVTTEKNNELGLSEARKLADDANQAKSEFLSSMSHELRTPMNAILGFGQLLENNPHEPLSDAQRDHTRQILKGGEHLLDLINQVLELSKIESGNLNFLVETIAPAEVINEAITMVRGQANSKNLDIFFSPPEFGLPQLSTDRSRLLQILLNLLSNAIKYNREAGQVTITCEDRETGCLLISIADTGHGIPTQKWENLFEPFNRLGKETGDIEGTGIGLTITKQIVEMMDGQIGFESEENVGSTFWIELPISVNQSTAMEITEDETIETIAAEAAGLTGIVLYIEDNPANIKLMEAVIKRLPHLVLKSAPTAEIGIGMARDILPDLILMDINLPGMDGIDALGELRSDERTRNTPIVAVSAAAMPHEVERGRDAGFDEYVTKPIKIPEIIKIISGHVG
ncbi:MAG: PAS domain S-box protein [Rhodospirillaceae bacterium]|nr:PAS domain S-box protein [Rhodospirillaceae bacterium]